MPYSLRSRASETSDISDPQRNKLNEWRNKNKRIRVTRLKKGGGSLACSAGINKENVSENVLKANKRRKVVSKGTKSMNVTRGTRASKAKAKDARPKETKDKRALKERTRENTRDKRTTKVTAKASKATRASTRKRKNDKVGLEAEFPAFSVSPCNNTEMEDLVGSTLTRDDVLASVASVADVIAAEDKDDDVDEVDEVEEDEDEEDMKDEEEDEIIVEVDKLLKRVDGGFTDDNFMLPPDELEESSLVQSMAAKILELEEEVAKMDELKKQNKELRATVARLRVLSSRKHKIDGLLIKAQEEAEEVREELENLQRERMEDQKKFNAQLKAQLKDIQKQHKMTLKEKEEEMKFLAQECSRMEDLEDELKELKERQEEEVAEVRESMIRESAELREQHELNEQRVQELEQALDESESECDRLRMQAKDNELLRRKLHNDIQDLKGSIRVMCRLRPRSSDIRKRCAYKRGGSASILSSIDVAKSTRLSLSKTNIADTAVGLRDSELTMIDEESIEGPVYEARTNDKEVAETLSVQSMKTGVDGTKKQDINDFKFDKVFGEKSTQIDLFENMSGLVTSCMDGYNVTVFAYGQTGSGKTHTMFGPGNAVEEEGKGVKSKWGQKKHKSSSRGMVPRTMEQIFSHKKDLAADGWQFTFQSTVLEIYNDEINDLLSSTQKNHRILSKDGKVNVTNLSFESVESVREVNQLIDTAFSNRAVRKTACNDQSSRSHTVFQLHLSGVNKTTKQKLSSVLSLVDLAGSERISQSKTTGQALKETQAINQSLSSLIGCITAIANKQSHIPFRDSKLTHLLQHSLGGKAKTLFFINISPEAQHHNESICTLRFAEKLRACELGYSKPASKPSKRQRK